MDKKEDQDTFNITPDILDNDQATRRAEDQDDLEDEQDPSRAKKVAPGVPSKVIVHPLVLLSVVDHYNRVAGDVDARLRKRVCGILLGKTHGSVVDVSSSYAVPFEEDPKNPQTWFFDHNYHEFMFSLCKKVNASEKVVGWYSTGPEIRSTDLAIHEVVRRYCAQPVFCIIDVKPNETREIPVKAYFSIPAVPVAGSVARREFVHLPSEIGAEEAEEIGVEHLLRTIKDVRYSTITDVVGNKLLSLKALHKRMDDIYKYLDNVCAGRLPPNPKILISLQEIFNYCPDLKRPELAEALTVKTNDSLITMYAAALMRSVTALHDLINNKLMNRAAEQSDAVRKAFAAAAKQVADEDDLSEDEGGAEALPDLGDDYDM